MTDGPDPIELRLTVNGERHEVTVEPRRNLADVLREDLGLTGTRIGCEHGSCGTCTVLLDGAPARSCLVLAVQLDAATRIETVESLADPDGLHPLQTAFLEERALQCGFCTSGFLMLGLELSRRRPCPTVEDIAEATASNLCRCTGYTPIARAIHRGIVELAGSPDRADAPLIRSLEVPLNDPEFR